MSEVPNLSSGWKRTAFAGVLAAAGLLSPMSAQASVLASPLSVALAGTFDRNCARTATISPSSVLSYRALGAMTKSEAILGGSVSALDRIRQEQAGLQTPQFSAPPLMADQPKCGGFQFVLPRPTPPVSRERKDESFLATQRIAVRRTSLSPQWERVSTAELTSATVHAMVGTKQSLDRTTLEEVNGWVNDTITYVEDRNLWSTPDYWASATETIEASSGDCEDFAILKYHMLLTLGVEQDDMYLTLARDLARNADHAVLIVRMDEQYYMLDNATNAILPADQAYDYRPTLSFNTESAWLHGAARRTPYRELAYRSVSATSNPRVTGFSR